MPQTFQNEVAKQIDLCLRLLENVYGNELLGIYLYGSSIIGGLNVYSDIDLFVVINRPSTLADRKILISQLLSISGIYMKSTKLPIEMTIVVKSDINPWHYPPCFDFQYGDWLRNQFETGIIEPYDSKQMPDLALLITQVLLASKTLFGKNPNQLLSAVPYPDFIQAITHELPSLVLNLSNDTRNVLLTLARMWCTVQTNTIRSKSAAADWVIKKLPLQHQSPMKRAKNIYTGNASEHWEDIKDSIKPCADFVLEQIKNQLHILKSSRIFNHSIKIEG